VGTSPPLDITRARSDAARQRVSILRAENEVTRARHRLLRLLGILGKDSAGADFRLTDVPQVAPMAVKLGDALAAARENRPDYRQALLDIENADLRAGHARNQRLPTLQLFGEYDLAGLDEDLDGSAERVAHGDHGSWLVGLRFEWPFPNRAARSDYEVARLRRRIARVGLQRLHEEIAREVSDALSDLETAEGRAESARQARELAERLLEAEEKSFSLGQSDSKDVLDAQQAVAVAERDEARARADFATAVANLLRAQGTLLQARGVAFARDAEKSGGE
jgi:outer membrane protein TolC